jgi:hypothetical protein
MSEPKESRHEHGAAAGTAEPGAGPDVADLDAAVETHLGKIVTELGAALGVLLSSLGTRSGLWAAPPESAR